MRKMIIGLAVMMIVAMSYPILRSGLQDILRPSDSLFTGNKIVGAGDTLWSTIYIWERVGPKPTIVAEWDVDTFNTGDSCKVELITQEGNTVNDWTTVTSQLSVSHAIVDYDTIKALTILPAAFIRFGFVDLNAADDTAKVKNLRVFIMR